MCVCVYWRVSVACIFSAPLLAYVMQRSAATPRLLFYKLHRCQPWEQQFRDQSPNFAGFFIVVFRDNQTFSEINVIANNYESMVSVFCSESILVD